MSEVNLRCCSPCFFKTGSQIYQSWLASKPQESACLHLPRAELTIAFKHSHLLNIDSWARTQVLDLAEQDLNWLDHLPSPASGFYLYGFFASQLTCLLRSFIVSHLLAPSWVIWSPLRPRFYLEVDFLFQSSGFLGLAQILPGVLCSCLCDRSLIFFFFFAAHLFGWIYIFSCHFWPFTPSSPITFCNQLILICFTWLGWALVGFLCWRVYFSTCFCPFSLALRCCWGVMAFSRPARCWTRRAAMVLGPHLSHTASVWLASLMTSSRTV